MALTWQDVAGRVEAPDFSDASQMITQGIGQLGTAVRDVVGGPEQRRKADLAKQVMLMDMQMQGVKEQMQMGRQLAGDMKVARKDKDIEEWGAAAAIIEAGARDAGLSGKKLEDYLNSNETYLALDAGARAVGRASASDSYLRGDELRIRRVDDAADDTRAQANANRSYAQSERHHNDSVARANRELGIREKEYNKREREQRESQGLYSQDAQTNLAFQNRLAQVAQQQAPLIHGKEKYGKMTPAEAAQMSGMDESFWKNGSDEAQVVADKVSKKLGKKVDPWMVNQLLAIGGNSINWDINPGGGLDDAKAEEYLTGLVELQDAASYNQQFLNTMVENMRDGKTYEATNLENYPIRTGVHKLPEPKKRKPQEPYAPQHFMK